MTIGIDIRTLMDEYYSGVPEYTHVLLSTIFKFDKNNNYKLFFNSLKYNNSNLPDFKFKNVEIIRTRYPNKFFNLVMQKNLSYPKIDRLLDCDLFFMPNAGFVSLSNKCKKILTIHDLSYLRYREFYSLKRYWWHKIINIKKLANKFDIIIALSENTKKDIIELLEIPEEKIHIIHSGLGKDYFKSSDIKNLEETRKKYSLPDKFILFLSTLEPRKNISSVIQAFEQALKNNPDLADHELVIAGGRGWRNKDIFKVWRESSIKSKIKIIGYVDKKDKNNLYNLSRLFVYPSYYEGFGFPPLEAMACGVPVITSTTSSLPEIARNAALKINPYNISEISQAISLTLKNNEYKIGLIKKGFRVLKNYNWEISAKKYLELFQE